MKESEHSQQVALFKLLYLNRNKYPALRFIFAVPNAAKRNPAQANYLLSEGLRSGVPDLVIPFQRHGWGGLFVEMKFGKNSLTPNQQAFFEHLKSENYLTEICRSWEEAARCIENYLDIKLIG